MSNWMFLFGRFFTVHADHYFPSCMTALKFSISFISLGERKHFLNNGFYLDIYKRDGKKLTMPCPFFPISIQPSQFKVTHQKHLRYWTFVLKLSQRWVTMLTKEILFHWFTFLDSLLHMQQWNIIYRKTTHFWLKRCLPLFSKKVCIL